jgi:hypothetical protein
VPSGARAHRPPDRLAARTRIAAPLLALVVGLLPGRFAAGPASSEGVLPPQCERQRGEEYETRGAATLEKLGDRFVLTVRCDGVHQIYARGVPGVQIEPFLGRPVRARYRYVEEVNPRTRCVRAPCPPETERLLEITAIEVLTEQ